MVKPPTALPTLPDDFMEMPVEQALEVLLRTVIRHHELFYELRRRNLTLIEWIEEEP